jgi:FkbM family methyltransferase
MNLMFEHKNPLVESSWSSSCRFEIGNDIMNFFDEEDLPIRFHVKKLLNGECIFSREMYANHWASHPAVEYCYIEAETAKGVSIFKDEWDPIKHGCLSDSLFYTWCLKNPRSNGLIIGANDGTGGDYVVPYMRGLIKNMVLVEASERTFKSLKRNYQNDSKVKTINKLVSTKTEKIKFYESTSGPGLVNSVYKNFANFFNEEIIEVEKEAIGINEIIAETTKEIEIDWLHIDVEGLDGELITAIDFEIFKPKIIIYENINRIGQKISSDDLSNFLMKKGYQVFGLDPQLNNIAILKSNNDEHKYSK